MAVDLKLILLGHKNVGKTSVFNRYIHDEFGQTTMTIGAYFGMKQCNLPDRSCNLAIWDTAGEEKFDSLTNFYCRNARAALICYDITNYESFQGLGRWVEKIHNEAEPNCAILIIGNKADVVEDREDLRKVSLAEAKRYASSINAHVLEASAKSGKNIREAFEQVVRMCFERQELIGTAKKGASSKNVNVNENPNRPSKGGCC